MADKVFDLKDAEIYLQDGTSRTAAANNVGGYTSGADTMAIDTLDPAGAIPSGTQFTIAGQTTVYTVVSSVGGATPTSITFTPDLTDNVADNAVITFGPNRLKIKVGTGNLSYTEKRNIEAMKDRGKLDQVRLGDEEMMDVNLEFTIRSMKASTGQDPTPEDVLKGRGAASGWKTTAIDPCDPYCVDIVVEQDPKCAEQQNQRITLRRFYWNNGAFDLKAATAAIGGVCNAQEAEIERYDAA